MPNVTIPSPGVKFATAKCPNCQATSDVLVDVIWYPKMVEWLKNMNTSTADIAAIKAFIGMP